MLQLRRGYEQRSRTAAEADGKVRHFFEDRQRTGHGPVPLWNLRARGAHADDGGAGADRDFLRGGAVRLDSSGCATLPRFAKEELMSVAEIANDLVKLCREGKNLEAINKYYADDIVSVESASGPGMPAEMKGIAAIRGKNEWWMANHEVHSGVANGPYVGKDQFAVQFIYDVTNKPSGKRFQIEEMALYTVK